MLGGLRKIGSAEAAATWCEGAERVVAAVAVLERVPYVRGWGRGSERRRRWQLGGQAVGEEGGRAA